MYHEYRKIRATARRIGISHNQDLIERNRDCRILVILHLFYPESWGEIWEYLCNLACYHPHILITYPEGQEETIRALNTTPFTGGGAPAL